MSEAKIQNSENLVDSPCLCFEIKNKQYLCKPGDELISDLFDKVKPGDELFFKNVLMCKEKIGTPYLSNLEVKCKVIKQLKGKKLHIIHLISQKRHRKRMGFRAKKTLLKVIEVTDSKNLSA